MAAILACAVHDVDHPGVNNLYLINTRESSPPDHLFSLS